MTARMPMSPPPAVVIEFMLDDRRVRTTVNQIDTSPGSPPSDWWLAQNVWDVETDERTKIGVRVQAWESVVRLDPGDGIERFASLLLVKLVPRPGEVQAAGVWQPMATAPKDCTWIIVLTEEGDEERVHWAEDLSGEDQPPFRGWFKDHPSPNCGFIQVRGPFQGWKPCESETT